MILEQKIDAVFAVIRNYTTFPREFVVGPSQRSSFVNCRTYAAVLLVEELGLSQDEAARVLKRDSRSAVGDLIRKARTKKGMAAELELLKGRLRERLAPPELTTD